MSLSGLDASDPRRIAALGGDGSSDAQGQGSERMESEVSF